MWAKIEKIKKEKYLESTQPPLQTKLNCENASGLEKPAIVGTCEQEGMGASRRDGTW